MTQGESHHELYTSSHNRTQQTRAVVKDELVSSSHCQGTWSSSCLAGVGSIAAAITTTKQLAKASYGLVINTGIAGGFASQAEVGSIVVASTIVAADLGAETPDGYIRGEGHVVR